MNVSERIVCQLGRNGDICAILPILYQDFLKTGERQRLMVAKDYAELLEGCSYIEPIIFDGSFAEINRAREYAQTLQGNLVSSQVVGGGGVVVSQIYGTNYDTSKTTESFQLESLRMMNALGEWRFQHPLVFDKRDKEREAMLIKDLPQNQKWIVVATSGTSSPFIHKELLHILLTSYFPKHHVVDLDKIKAERFYDLLGIMDHKNTLCIVAIDSAPLHLAHGANKPVIALVTDKPTMWHGAAYRPNHIKYIRYNEFASQAVPMINRIEKIAYPGCRFAKRKKGQKIVHLYSDYVSRNEDDKRRQEVARATWRREYAKMRWEVAAIPDGALFKKLDGMPYIKALYRQACLHAEDDDILLFSNSDICFVEGFTERVFKWIKEYPAIACTRRDLKRFDAPVPNSQVLEGEDYVGKDVFIFSKAWWREYSPNYPEMILGREAWDKIMAELIVIGGGAIIRNLIYHETHHSFWLQDRDNNEGNKYNRSLAIDWLRERGKPLQELEAWATPVVPVAPVSPSFGHQQISARNSGGFVPIR